MAGVIVGFTEAIAAWRDVPEFGVDPTEATELMGATQDVLRHYSIETTQKGADFIALAGVVSMIFGTRVGAYKLRTRMEREQAQQQRPFNVVQMPASQSQSRQPQQQSPVTASVPQPDYQAGTDES